MSLHEKAHHQSAAVRGSCKAPACNSFGDIDHPLPCIAVMKSTTTAAGLVDSSQQLCIDLMYGAESSQTLAYPSLEATYNSLSSMLVCIKVYFLLAVNLMCSI
eukprot:GHUV01040150.1.p1 GENE.GHUV01040150.1~~GHUV01040150.1.p1  ORF type:complete len:103 (-),score=6.74 GHUV01040150.1:566-874(-)